MAEKKRRTRRLVQGAAIAALLAAAVFLLLHPPTRELLARGLRGVREELLTFVAWLRDLGAWGAVFFIVIYVAACVLFLPGSVLTAAAGFAFGLLWGTVLVSLGSVLGVSAAFLLARTLARRLVERKLSTRPRFRALDEAVGREGFKIVLLTRLSPVFPFNLLNYAFGVTRVSFRDYVLASWIGMLPGTVLYVYLGSAARSLTELMTDREAGGAARYAQLALGLAATAAVTVVLTRAARRALKEAVAEEGQEKQAAPAQRGEEEEEHA